MWIGPGGCVVRRVGCLDGPLHAGFYVPRGCLLGPSGNNDGPVGHEAGRHVIFSRPGGTIACIDLFRMSSSSVIWSSRSSDGWG